MSVDVRKITSSEATGIRIAELVARKVSFQVTGVVNMGAVVSEIEGTVEKKGMTCRIYTEYRAAAVAGSLWTPTVILGIAAAVGMAAHNLATINPDYEIGKNKVAGTVTATYKK
jgi:hypothetical protein